jgi:hypothetical protein
VSEKQKESLSRLTEAMDKLPDEKIEYLIGFADGMSYQNQKAKEAQSDAAQPDPGTEDDDLPFN